MRIGIDVRMWNETGIGRYIRNVVGNFTKIDKDNEFVLFGFSDVLSTIDLPSNFQKVSADIRWNTFAEQFQLPFIYYSQNLDVLFVPNFNVPLIYLKPVYVTIHDLTVLKFKTGRATTLPYFLYILKRFAAFVTLFSIVKRSEKIFTVSEFVKNDVIETIGVDVSKIIVAPCSVEDKFKPIPFGDQLLILQKYGISKPYLFYVGNAHPHKNLERLLQAFELISETHPDLTLVLGGSKKFFYERLEHEYKDSKISSRIKFIGYVEDNDLPALYSGSEMFINPSLYEGFGIQLLEAFACHSKVCCSKTSSLPEVGGDVPFYFDPYDISSIITCVEECLKTPQSEDRILRGENRLEKYSWNTTSAKILSSLTGKSV